MHEWQANKGNFRSRHHERSIAIETSRCSDMRSAHPKISHNYNKSSDYLRREIYRVIAPHRDKQ